MENGREEDTISRLAAGVGSSATSTLTSMMTSTRSPFNSVELNRQGRARRNCRLVRPALRRSGIDGLDVQDSADQ
jgi:hypothetical protein